MKTNRKYLGLVTKKFNDFFLVDLKSQEKSGNSQKFLCKVKKSINFKDQLIDVSVLHNFNATKIPDSPPEIQLKNIVYVIYRCLNSLNNFFV